MATNKNQAGKIITLTWSTTSPVAGAPCVKTSAKASGGITGVAQNGTGVASENVSVDTEGVYTLSVTAAAGAIAVGDYIFVADPGGVEVSTAALSNTNTGLCFGVALEAVGNGLTASIRVLLRQPAHI